MRSGFTNDCQLEIMTPEECIKAHRIVEEKRKERTKGTEKSEQTG